MIGMNRPPDRRGKPRRRDGRHGGKPQGRRPPPPATGLESKFFESSVRRRQVVVLSVGDGQTIRGVVSEHDNDQIVIEGENGPVVIRKSEIRYILEETGTD